MIISQTELGIKMAKGYAGRRGYFDLFAGIKNHQLYLQA